jgi:hypothetical protein
VRSAAFGRFALFRRFRFHDGLCARIPVVPAALGSDTSANPGFRFERSQTDLATNACPGQSRISLVARIRIDWVAGIIGASSVFALFIPELVIDRRPTGFVG